METSDQRTSGNWNPVPLVVVLVIGQGVEDWIPLLDADGRQLLIRNDRAEYRTVVRMVGGGKGIPEVHVGHCLTTAGQRSSLARKALKLKSSRTGSGL